MDETSMDTASNLREPLKWTWTITKRRRPMDDPFFEEGNIVCNLKFNQWTVVENIDDILQSSSVPEFSCHVSTCVKRFKSIMSYELHYNSEHRHTCSQCHRTFPNSRILDIHVLEWHDSMFELLSQKQKMYECLSDGCGKKFSTAKGRKEHLIKVHKYPPSFRFDRRKTTQKKNKEPSTQNTKSDIESKQEKMEAEVSENKENAVSMATEVEKTAEDGAQKRFQYSYKVPKNISFGHGVQRGFQRPGGRGRRGRKKHWHQTQEDNMDTSVNIEQVDMKELADILDS